MRVWTQRGELRFWHPGWFYGKKDLSSHLQHLTSAFSSTCELFSGNGHRQFLPYQSLPHSFPCNGGGRVSSPTLSLATRFTPLAPSRDEGSFEAPLAQFASFVYGRDCTRHCTCKSTPLFSIICRMLLPQLFSFHDFALLPGGGCASPAPPCRRERNT